LENPAGDLGCIFIRAESPKYNSPTAKPCNGDALGKIGLKEFAPRRGNIGLFYIALAGRGVVFVIS